MRLFLVLLVTSATWAFPFPQEVAELAVETPQEVVEIPAEPKIEELVDETDPAPLKVQETPESIPEVASEAIIKVAPESIPEVASEVITEVVQESTPEEGTESIPEVVQESTPEEGTEAVPIVSAESLATHNDESPLLVETEEATLDDMPPVVDEPQDAIVVKDVRIMPDAEGDFDLVFQTSNGISIEEHGRRIGEETLAVAGVIRFTFDDGIPFELKYIADENGFRPVGNLLPKMPQHAIDQRRRAELLDEIDDALYDTDNDHSLEDSDDKLDKHHSVIVI